jgi:hypothetical protein
MARPIATGLDHPGIGILLLPNGRPLGSRVFVGNAMNASVGRLDKRRRASIAPPPRQRLPRARHL